jgi:hypothetical protein
MSSTTANVDYHFDLIRKLTDAIVLTPPETPAPAPGSGLKPFNVYHHQWLNEVISLVNQYYWRESESKESQFGIHATGAVNPIEVPGNSYDSEEFVSRIAKQREILMKLELQALSEQADQKLVDYLNKLRQVTSI